MTREKSDFSHGLSLEATGDAARFANGGAGVGILKSNFRKYISAIFIESRQRIFIAFDILGIVLFLVPSLVGFILKDESIARTIGAIIFFSSFLAANFSAYSKLLNTTYTGITNDCIQIYTNLNYALIGGELRYFCEEPAKSFSVELHYQDNDGAAKIKPVTHFYPEPKMSRFPESINVLSPGQALYFELPPDSDITSKPILVYVTAKGAKSEKEISIQKTISFPSQ